MKKTLAFSDPIKYKEPMTHDIANAWDTTKSREFNRTAWPWQVACDGHEIPMRLGAGEWALYCFNFHTRKHGYYLFEKDIFVGEDYFSPKTA